MSEASSRIHSLRRVVSLRGWLKRVGVGSINLSMHAGGIAMLLRDTVAILLHTPLRWKATVDQMNKIGVMSLPLVFLTALFTGMVLSLQSAYQLKLFAATQ